MGAGCAGSACITCPGAQILTEALVTQANKAVSDPDQAWILTELIRYLQQHRSSAAEFEDMGAAWVEVREAARSGSLRASDKGAMDVVRRYEQLMSFAAMLMCRELGVDVRPALSRSAIKRSRPASAGRRRRARRQWHFVRCAARPERSRADRGDRRPASQPPVLLDDRRRAHYRPGGDPAQLAAEVQA
jgi:hypothetical protein